VRRPGEKAVPAPRRLPSERPSSISTSPCSPWSPRHIGTQLRCCEPRGAKSCGHARDTELPLLPSSPTEVPSVCFPSSLSIEEGAARL